MFVTFCLEVPEPHDDETAIEQAWDLMINPDGMPAGLRQVVTEARPTGLFFNQPVDAPVALLQEAA